MGDLAWQVSRRNSSFRVVRREAAFTMSKDPMSLTGVFAKRFSGCNDNAVNVVPMVGDKKGNQLANLKLVKKTKATQHKAAPTLEVARKLKAAKGGYKATIEKELVKKNFRKDMKLMALRKAALLIKSRPVQT